MPRGHELPRPLPGWLHWVSRFVRSRFSPSRYLGLHFTLGILAIALALWAFIAIADAVHENDDIAAFDSAIATWLHEHSADPLTATMPALTALGAPPLVLATSFILAAVFWINHHYTRALFLLAVVPVGLLLNTALKFAFTRTRPILTEPLATAHGYSFPSGHVAGATLLYSSLALILLRTFQTRPARVVTVAIAALLILTVSFTRLYLGVHYLTDVLAAQAIALSWVALCATAIDTLRRRRALLET